MTELVIFLEIQISTSWIGRFDLLKLPLLRTSQNLKALLIASKHGVNPLQPYGNYPVPGPCYTGTDLLTGNPVIQEQVLTGQVISTMSSFYITVK